MFEAVNLATFQPLSATQDSEGSTRSREGSIRLNWAPLGLDGLHGAGGDRTCIFTVGGAVPMKKHVDFWTLEAAKQRFHVLYA